MHGPLNVKFSAEETFVATGTILNSAKPARAAKHFSTVIVFYFGE